MTVLYPFIFALIVLGWPWADVDTAPMWQTAVKVVVDYGVFALVAYRTSSPTLSFWAGLTRVSMSLRTGCANLTIMIVLPVCFVLYVMAIFFTLIGLFVGKTWTEDMWVSTTGGIGFGSIDDSYDEAETFHDAGPPRFSTQTDEQKQRTGPSPEFLRSLKTVGIDGSDADAQDESGEHKV